MNQVARPAPDRVTAATADTTHYAHRRAAIDLIATTRARMIRCALFGTFLQRPAPGERETPASRIAWRDRLADQLAGMDRACAVLKGRDPEGVLPEDICAWIGAQAEAWPEHIAIIEQMRDLTQAILDTALERGPALDRALQQHFDLGSNAFFHAVTGFCDGLWAKLDETRHAEMIRATETARTISDTLKRLEHIGKHVRLVSLNASVEAARVGDEGKGLGVIAVEFKSLAEEIQDLAISARTRIDGLGATG